MINLNNKNYNLYILKIAPIFIVMLLLIFTYNIKTSAADIEWNVTINFNETTGKNDYIIIGESFYASDDLDSYDVPNPPGGVSPALDAYITTDFTYPHNRLLQEIKEHPDTNKEWDFTVQWIDEGTAVNVTMSWDVEEINDGLYNSVFLYDGNGTFLIDMSINNNYEFLCPSYSPVDFKIVCSSTSNDGNNGKENTPPTANAAASETFGFVDMLMTFNGSLSTDIDGYVTSWLWNFGDNSTGSGEITTHAYINVGIYTVTLMVYDNDNATSSDTITVVINKVNIAPTKPVVNGTTKGNKNAEYTYTAVSTDFDNDTIS